MFSPVPVIDNSINVMSEESADKIMKPNILMELAQDYSTYLKVDVSSEKSALDDEVEDLLTRLDEFTSMIDMVRGDNVLCLNNTVPEIHKKCEEMEKVFQKIDQMEAVVQKVKLNLDAVEEKVVEAEEQLNNNSVKKIFSSFQKPLFSKKSSERRRLLKYEPPEIFRTEDFFANSHTDSEPPESRVMKDN